MKRKTDRRGNGGALQLFVITGLSGAGKSQTLKTFEDIGFFCVDNLPVSLVGSFADYLLVAGEYRRVALGLDIRERDFLEGFSGVLRDLRSRGIECRILFLDSPDKVLVQRFSDRVTFTGLRDDIPAILAQTDIFVLPSHSEGLSNALMEAMASGCACIASDTGGNGFLIRNGISGFLFPPGDRPALAAHIRRLLSDPAKRKMLGEGAQRRIEEHFGWNVVGERYRDLFAAIP